MKNIVYGASLKGNRHYKEGIACQDSNSYDPDDNIDSPFKIIAISDGHGSRLYCRSDIGSKLAVRIAKEELNTLLTRSSDLLDQIDKEQISLDMNFKEPFCTDANTSARAVLESRLNSLKEERRTA